MDQGPIQQIMNSSLVMDLTVVDTENYTAKWNFGQKPFKFPPPDGFQPLNTANTRPVKVISRPDQYVGVTTYRGNGANQHVNGFKPDLVINLILLW